MSRWLSSGLRPSHIPTVRTAGSVILGTIRTVRIGISLKIVPTTGTSIPQPLGNMSHGKLIDLAEQEFRKVCEPFDIVVQTIYDSYRSRTVFSFMKLWKGHQYYWNLTIPDEDKILYRHDEQNIVDLWCVALFRSMMFALKRRLN